MQPNYVVDNTSIKNETNHNAKMNVDGGAMFARSGKGRKNEGVVLMRREIMQIEWQDQIIRKGNNI